MEEPKRPKYFRLWMVIKMILFVSIYLIMININFLENIWILGVVVVFLALYYLIDVKKMFPILEAFDQYQKQYLKYQNFCRSNMRYNQVDAERDCMVNENIKKYLEEQKRRKSEAKWWQFWV